MDREVSPIGAAEPTKFCALEDDIPASKLVVIFRFLGLKVLLRRLFLRMEATSAAVKACGELCRFLSLSNVETWTRFAPPASAFEVLLISTNTVLYSGGGYCVWGLFVMEDLCRVAIRVLSPMTFAIRLILLLRVCRNILDNLAPVAVV